MTVSIIVAVLLTWDEVPDLTPPPGALNPAVTQATISQTICMRGWTRTVRPARDAHPFLLYTEVS
jgi:hypothetical protein